MSFDVLRNGDTVALVAPAGPVEPERLALVPALYAHFGLQAKIYPGCEQRAGYLAGDDDARAADLNAALADDGIAAIHCVRGGYGCMRLLDRIDAALVRRAAKLLIGYSDITALHALWCSQGVPSLHAPMAASDMLLPGRRPGHDSDRDAVFSLLQQGLRAGDLLLAQPASNTAELNVPGQAEGMLIGGNLSLVAALLGTPWAWPAQGAILFLEDVNEELYRIDRLLTQLRLAGVLNAVSAIVLGSFTESQSPLPLLRQMLLSHCQRLNKPLLGGWPSGHGTPNRPLPLGVRVRLDATDGRITLLQDFMPAK